MSYCMAIRRVVGLRGFSTSSLVRTSDFIHDALYNADYGYFSKLDVITSPPAAIKFGDLLGKSEYQHILSQVYSKDDGWSTPVEIFAPWYSRALARYLLQWHTTQRAVGNPRQPLVVYELGGGKGTNARHICDFLRATSPGVYKNLRYTVLEISHKLQKAQTAALAEHAGVARSIVMDAMELGNVARGIPRGSSTSSPSWPSGVGSGYPTLPDPSPCVVIAMEVLDNLPHGKLVGLQSDREGVALHEAFVERLPAEPSGQACYAERYLPVQQESEATECARLLGLHNDSGAWEHEVQGGKLPPLYQAPTMLARLAGRFTSSGSGFSSRLPPAPPGLVWARYVPTGALRLIKSLRTALPRHHLLLADFTHLPEPVVHRATVASDCQVSCYAPGAGAPLVASKERQAGTGAERTRTVDHATYMSAKPGTADIFFPTDFRALAKLVDGVKSGSTASSSGMTVAGAASAAATGGHVPRPSSSVKIQTSAAFLAAYAEVERTRTLTGYNPMLQDYPNTAVLTT